jgi:hypothetical protein
MELFAVVTITLIIIILIIIFILIIVFSVTKNINNSCSSQNDCQKGYVCVPTNGSNVCKAGLGTLCKTNDDCSNLSCKNNTCTNPEIIEIQEMKPQEIKSQETTIQEIKSQEIKSQEIQSQETTLISTYGGPNVTELTNTKVIELKTITPKNITINPTNTIVTNPIPINPIVTNTIVTNNISTNPIVTNPTTINTIVTNPIPMGTVVTNNNNNNKLGKSFGNYNVSVTPLTGMEDDIIEEKKKITRITRVEDTSTDIECNSYGNREDRGFDILSGDSTDNSEVTTPYEKKDGNYYCRDNGNESVIDVCSYSDSIIFLLKGGKIICEQENNKKKVTNNIVLIRITSFNGYLYGLSDDNILYTLSNDMYLLDEWIWDISKWAPKNIIHISSTHDSNYLWVQTERDGYLYHDNNYVVFECHNYKMKRVYGRTNDNYVEIDTNSNKAIVRPSNITYENIYDAALSYYDEIVYIATSENNVYRGISMVNWSPSFIRH